MYNLQFTEKKFAKLKAFIVDENSWNTEAKMYYYNKYELIKAYRSSDEGYLQRKNKDVLNLMEFIYKENIPEILRPNGLFFVNSKFKGIVLPRIEGYNSSIYLNSINTPINIKIAILKQIGKLLERIKDSDKRFDAAFADVHADNFMIIGEPYKNLYNPANIEIKACDTESMKILDSKGTINFYLYGNSNLENINKYNANEFGIINPNSNTDLYCFIMMVMEIISRDNLIYSLSIDEYKRYIDYLDKLGFNGDLLNSLASVYDNTKDNISPVPYLDYIAKANSESSMLSFYKNYR